MFYLKILIGTYHEVLRASCMTLQEKCQGRYGNFEDIAPWIALSLLIISAIDQFCNAYNISLNMQIATHVVPCRSLWLGLLANDRAATAPMIDVN